MGAPERRQHRGTTSDRAVRRRDRRLLPFGRPARRRRCCHDQRLRQQEHRPGPHREDGRDVRRRREAAELEQRRRAGPAGPAGRRAAGRRVRPAFPGSTRCPTDRGRAGGLWARSTSAAPAARRRSAAATPSRTPRRCSTASRARTTPGPGRFAAFPCVSGTLTVFRPVRPGAGPRRAVRQSYRRGTRCGSPPSRARPRDGSALTPATDRAGLTMGPPEPTPEAAEMRGGIAR